MTSSNFILILNNDTIDNILYYFSNCETLNDLELIYAGIKIYSANYLPNKKEIDDHYSKISDNLIRSGKFC